MEHSHGGLHLTAEQSAWPLVLRLALLLTTALVAGTGLVRPWVTVLPRRVRFAASFVAAVAALLVLVSVLAADVHVLAAAAHAVLVIAVPLLLGRPLLARWVSVALVVLLVVETAVGGSGVAFAVEAGYVAAAVTWFGAAVLALAVPEPDRKSDVRPGSLAVALGAILVIAGVIRLITSGVAFDRRIYESGLGLVLLAVVLLPLVVTVLAVLRADRAYRYGTAAIAVAFVAWSALAAVPAPPELPVPGVPVLAEASLAGQRVPVLISPHRPGRNLVHVPQSAGHVEVTGPGAAPVHAGPRAGADGSWAEVELPPGRSSILLSSGTGTASVDVDAGDEAGPVAAQGVDGPECASAALGGLITGRREVLSSCPSEVVSPEDEEALRRLVWFLGARKAGAITLAADSSPRGVRAAEVVREAAGPAGLRVDPEQRPGNALVVVSGWAAAHESLTTAGVQQAERPIYSHGLYLAPWLLTTPLATSVTTVSVPLRFDPREQQPVSYAVAVGNGFGGENPTPAGFRAWLGDRPAPAGGVRIYAVAQVTAMPMGSAEAHAPGMPMTEELAGQWVPLATVVPVSAPLLG